jgi:hypothetical protein
MRGKTEVMNEPTGMRETAKGFGAYKWPFSRMCMREKQFWSP